MSRTIFACSQCAYESVKWLGRCPGCGEWSSLVEERVRAAPGSGQRGSKAAGAPGGGASGGGASGRLGSGGLRAGAIGSRRAGALKPVPLAEVEAPAHARLETGIGELDRVLGGGLVPGSLVLIGGSPGIGKSTITGGALGNLVATGRSALYVSGEESPAQVRLRAERLGADALRVPVIAETELDAVVATIEAERPDVCVVDSVQTLYAPDLSGAPGSVGQVREVAGCLMRVAKQLGVAIVLVGHVTKEGALAGPRALEHLVDCVLQFEGERERTYRTLRALKNRFGSTDEVGVFEMREHGLVEVEDASQRFVAEATRAPGSLVLCAMEGSRPLLVEVQALVAQSELAQPRRVANGIDRNRLALVLAVLSRHAGIGLGACDVFVSVAGGVRVDEPGADLAVALALASGARGEPLWRDERPLAAFGEIGLTGELRHVAHPDRRIAEAQKFGLEPVLAPGGRAGTVAEALELALGADEQARPAPARVAA